MAEMPKVVLIMHPFAGYDRGLLQGIARYVQNHGPWRLYLSGEQPGVPMPESDSISGKTLGAAAAGAGPAAPFSLRRLGAAGIIGRIQTPRIARTILESGLPAIAIELSGQQLSGNQPLSRISEIRADSHQAGRLAAEHLLERGFTHFGYCGFHDRIWSQRRREGFCRRLEEQGHSCSVYEHPERRRTLSWPEEQASVTDWLRALAKPAGIMACNDIRGRQVVEACLLAGFRVPDDVAVVGVDEDRLLCDLAYPGLSSVTLNLERAGYRAAELLDGLMSGRIHKAQRIMVDAMWVTARRSTDVVAVEDRHVAAATRFIRDHFRKAITVEGVVGQSGVSRRNLEIRFRRSLRQSIRQTIQQMRLAWSKQLLTETNLSAGKIAELSGFSSLSYMSSVFRRELATTVTAYRRQARNP
jgi:LacI family transcriptional regulator